MNGDDVAIFFGYGGMGLLWLAFGGFSLGALVTSIPMWLCIGLYVFDTRSGT